MESAVDGYEPPNGVCLSKLALLYAVAALFDARTYASGQGGRRE